MHHTFIKIQQTHDYACICNPVRTHRNRNYDSKMRLAEFNALMHTTCMRIIMETVLQCAIMEIQYNTSYSAPKWAILKNKFSTLYNQPKIDCNK